MRVVAAAGLVIDAVVHLLLAPDYDANRGILLTQVELFRIEAAAAIVAAFALLGVRRRGTDVPPFVDAAALNPAPGRSSRAPTQPGGCPTARASRSPRIPRRSAR